MNLLYCIEYISKNIEEKSPISPNHVLKHRCKRLQVDYFFVILHYRIKLYNYCDTIQNIFSQQII